MSYMPGQQREKWGIKKTFNCQLSRSSYIYDNCNVSKNQHFLWLQSIFAFPLSETPARKSFDVGSIDDGDDDGDGDDDDDDDDGDDSDT